MLGLSITSTVGYRYDHRSRSHFGGRSQHQTDADRSRIKHMLFGGFARGLSPMMM